MRIATLWELEWNSDRLSCGIYRDRTGLELRIESPVAVVVAERFEIRPRALARAHTVRDSLKRRGWREAGRSTRTDAGDTDTPPAE